MNVVQLEGKVAKRKPGTEEGGLVGGKKNCRNKHSPDTSISHANTMRVAAQHTLHGF